MPLRVFLVDITNRIGDDARRTAVKVVLQTYFDRVAAKAKSDKVSVLFVSDDPKPNDNDLIAYYSTSGWHVVSQMAGAPEVKAAEGGLTYNNGTVTGSDVVANPDDDTTMVANLTFHEFMHNKLNLDDSMHRLGGLARSPVDESTPLTNANIEAMAKVLIKDRKQWTGGFALLKDRHKPASVK